MESVFETIDRGNCEARCKTYNFLKEQLLNGLVLARNVCLSGDAMSGSIPVKIDLAKPDTDGPSDLTPEQIKVYVPPDVWESYSQVRKDSFRQMFSKPNAFFYRNRPPGDPQRNGKFTEEEEAQFLERLKYFREELGIMEGQWGLFAVPLRGRLGYQCSQFFRELLLEGKIKGVSYNVANGKLIHTPGKAREVPPESIAKLEAEAHAFVRSCLASSTSKDGETFEITIPEKVEAKRAPTRSSSSSSSKKEKNDNRCKDRDKLSDEWSVLRNASDSVTCKPMTYPMMDTSTGIVLDKSTWEGIFSGKLQTSVNTKVGSINGLVKMTKRNFQRYWMDVVNVNF